MKMTAEMLDKQKELLLHEKERLEKEVKGLSKYPDYGDLEDDNTQELVDFENNLSIEEQLVFLLRKVNLALKSIDEGTYGKCKKCGDAIEMGRLKIMPYAELCVTCKMKK